MSLLFFPGALWRSSIRSRSLAVWLHKDGRQKEYARRILKLFVLPFTAAWLLTGLIGWGIDEIYPYPILHLILPIIVAVLLFLIMYRCGFVLSKRYHGFDPPQKSGYALYLGVISGVAFLSGSFSLYVVAGLFRQSGPSPESTPLISCLFFLSVVVIVASANFIIASERETQWGWIVLAAGLTFFLISAAGRGTALSTGIVRGFGLGGAMDAQIVVKEEGMALFEKLNLRDDKRCPKDKGNVCTVQILSSIGREFFLQVDSTRFTLPKDMVLSWAVLSTEKKPTSAGDPSAQ